MEVIKKYLPWIVTALALIAMLMAVRNSKRIQSLSQRSTVPLNSQSEKDAPINEPLDGE